MVQFVKQDVMVNSIKGFRKIKDSVSQTFFSATQNRQKLRFANMTATQVNLTEPGENVVISKKSLHLGSVSAFLIFITKI